MQPELMHGALPVSSLLSYPRIELRAIELQDGRASQLVAV